MYILHLGALPLRGTIPDMTADSTRYIQLQHVYHHQADDDVTIITDKVRTIEQNIAKVRFSIKLK